MPPRWPKPPSTTPWFAALRLPHFPAQALAARDPALRGRAFAVVEQDSESHKTPLRAVSRAAREAGAEAGMPAFLARKRGLLLLPRDPGAEAEAGAGLEALFLSFTPAYSLRGGEALLDMTGTPAARRESPEGWALRLRNGAVRLGLEDLFLGAASSRVAARVAACLPSAGGVRICAPGREAALLAPLSPDFLPELSPAARARLRRYGLDSVEKLRSLDREELGPRFGAEADRIFCLARGLDYEAVIPRNIPLEAETVLPRDLNDAEALRGQVRLTADKLGHGLRDRHSLAGRLALALQYSDGRGARKTLRLHPPTASFLRLAEGAETLFAALHQRRVALRRIRLQATACAADTGQTDLFDLPARRKQEALAEALCRIRGKRGFEEVIPASALVAASAAGGDPVL